MFTSQKLVNKVRITGVFSGRKPQRRPRVITEGKLDDRRRHEHRLLRLLDTMHKEQEYTVLPGEPLKNYRNCGVTELTAVHSCSLLCIYLAA